jgi:hypothetical protein
MNREKNEVRWSPVPLESLLNVDAIINYWRPRGMVVHRTPSLRPFPDLTMPEAAFPQYPLGTLDPNLVVRQVVQQPLCAGAELCKMLAIFNLDSPPAGWRACI